MPKLTESPRCWWRDGRPADHVHPKIIEFPRPSAEPADAGDSGGCPARDTLELHALGRLEPAEAEWIDQHLWLCESCSEFHDLDQQFAAALRKAHASPRAAAAASGK